MKNIGVRELRQRASEVLRQVEAGASFEVTDRGRPVALLAPLPAGSPLERLRDAGELIEATIDADFPPPLAPKIGRASVSALLARMRVDER